MTISLVLLAAGYVPPLTDANGVPYPHAALPCTGNPDAWDEDAPAELQHNAARVCHTCPAFTACRDRAIEYRELARGVWGGMVFVPALPPVPAEADTSDEAVSPMYDATVAHLLVLSGTELRPARSRQ